MQKRGQVTVFIVVGILVLLIMGLILFFSGEKTTSELTEYDLLESTQIGGNLQAYTESCLSRVGEEAILFVGKQGGYYELPSLYDQDFQLPYYFYDNKSKLQSKQELEQQLSLYVDQQLSFCLRNFEFLRNKGFKIKMGEIKTEVKVMPKQVVFRVKSPIYISKDATGKELTLFETKVGSRLNSVHTLVNEFSKQNSTPVCLSCLNQLALQNDLQVEMSPTNDSFLFTVVDKKVKIKNKEYQFEFVNKYE